MDGAADGHGFVVAYPQADIPLRSGFAWNIPGQAPVGPQAVPADAADDVAFLEAGHYFREGSAFRHRAETND